MRVHHRRRRACACCHFQNLSRCRDCTRWLFNVLHNSTFTALYKSGGARNFKEPPVGLIRRGGGGARAVPTTHVHGQRWGPGMGRRGVMAYHELDSPPEFRN